MIPLVLGVEPIRLATGAESHAPASSGTDWPIVAIATLSILLILTLGALAWRIIRRVGPEERAFRIMARRLRLRRSHRAAMRALAASIETPPVALAICPSAFLRAVAALATSDAPPEPGLADLQHRLFG